MSPIAGKRIVNTRALHQAGELDTLLHIHKAIPISYPCIAIVPPSDTISLENYLTTLHQFDWLILTSANTVHALQNHLIQIDIMPDWEQIQVAVVGRKTADAFHQIFQHQPNFIPDPFTAESLAKSLPIQAGERAFVPQSALADNILADTLSQRGASVTCITAYQTVIGRGGDDVPAMLSCKEIDALTFTSPSTVKNFLRRIHPQPIPDGPAICIGPSTANTATQLGFTQVILPDEFTLQGMIDRLIQLSSS